MKIRIDPHTVERADERGTTEDEIRDVLETGNPVSASPNRLCKAKVYPFEREHLGRHHRQKRVEVLYVMDQDIAVTVTVYVFFGEWKDGE